MRKYRAYLERYCKYQVDLAETLLAKGAGALVLRPKFFLRLDDLQLAPATSVLLLPHQSRLPDALVHVFLYHRHASSHHLQYHSDDKARQATSFFVVVETEGKYSVCSPAIF